MLGLEISHDNRTKTTVNWLELKEHCELILRRLNVADRVKLELVVVGDREIEKLQQQFFNRNEPTDVLSFPAPQNDPSPDEPRFLGSIVISLPTATRQAHSSSLPIGQELQSLTGHGLLHLLGYHHR